jgi:hypothetical protein
MWRLLSRLAVRAEIFDGALVMKHPELLFHSL